MALSVGVFIDYQNAYNRAREAFAGPYASAQDGQFHPVAFGHLIASLEPDRELAKVHTYRGQPDPRRDPKGAGACQRQLEAWRRAGVDVTTRPLGGYQYGRPKEKGIDVLLALDFVDHAMAGTYDIQVLVSADSDLIPALERAQRFADARSTRGEEPKPRLETVAWMPSSGGARRLKTGKLPVTERAITAPMYRKVEDPRDYAIRA